MSLRLKLVETVKCELPGLLPTDDSLPSLAPIDFAFATRMKDLPKCGPAGITTAFDSLLDELNELLTRCLSHERAKEELEEKALTYWLSHSRDLALTQLRRRLLESETETDVRTADIELAALEETLNRLIESEAKRRDAADWRRPDAKLAKERVEKTSLITAYLATISPEVVQPLSSELEVNRLSLEYASAVADLHSLLAEISKLKGNKEIARVRQNFFRAKRTLRLEENQIELDAIERRRVAATAQHSPLNFSDRITAIQQMFDADFCAAITRARSLGQGLAQIFKLDAQLPPLADHGMLAAFVVWTRHISEKLFQITESAVATAFAVSLHDLLQKKDWELLINGSEISVDFTPPKELKGNRWCLLRAIRTEIVGDDNVPLGVQLMLPPSDFEPREVVVLTTDIRVNDAFGITGGINSRQLQNRPPFGQWKIKLLNLPSKSVIRNVVLKLNVAVIK